MKAPGLIRKVYRSIFSPIDTIRSKADWRNLLLILFWTGMLGMTALFGFIIPMVDDWMIVAAFIAFLAGIAFTVYLMNNLHLGFYILIGGALFFPYELGTGSQTGLNIAIMMVIYMFGLWVFKMVVIEQNIKVFPSRPMLPLILFVISVTFSFFMGQLRWFPTNGAPLRAQIGGLAVFYLSALAFIVFSQLIPNIRVLKQVHWFFVLCASGFLLFIVFLTVVPPSLAAAVGSWLPISAAGSMLWVWIPAFVFSQLIYNRKLNLLVRLALAVVLLAFLYSRFIESSGRNWTSGWLPGFVAIVTILLIGSPRYGVALGMVGGIGILLNWALVSSQVMGGDNVYSLDTRVEAWVVLAKIIMVNPITGFGPANYYWYTHLHNILGYFVPFNSHNNYVDIIAQAGIIGLGFYFWFMFEVGRLGYSIYLKLPEGFAKVFALGCLGGLAGVLVGGMFGDWVLPFVYNVRLAGFRASMLPWLFFGGLVVIERSLKDGSFENT